MKKIKLVKSQIELLKVLAIGETLKKSAELLGISFYSIEKRTHLLYKKFHVNKRKDLITEAIQCGYLSYRDIKSKFRKRYVSKTQRLENVEIEALNEKEIEYLNLCANGKTKKEIIQQMHIVSMFACNVLMWGLCAKLNAQNMCEAIFNGKEYLK